MGYNVAVVGATGNVGREMLDILAERIVSRRRGGCARLAPQHWASKSRTATGR